MILLLDAHALLWWLADDATLDAQARDAIANPTNDVLVSAATVWEIAIKRAMGKLVAPDGLTEVIDRTGFGVLPITGADGEHAGKLPLHHQDPFRSDPCRSGRASWRPDHQSGPGLRRVRRAGPDGLTPAPFAAAISNA